MKNPFGPMYSFRLAIALLVGGLVAVTSVQTVASVGTSWADGSLGLRLYGHDVTPGMGDVQSQYAEAMPAADLAVNATAVGPGEQEWATAASVTASVAATRTHAVTYRIYLPLVSRSQIVHVAVIGDYGAHSQAEQDVANLVKSWHPDLIITTGDNNCEEGAAGTIDLNVGQYYSAFIYPYRGSYVSSNPSLVNRFFPTLGNHDWVATGARPYIDYFTLPGNERYYDFVWGPIHFFALDSDEHEPDGVTRDSVQATWLRDRLAASTATWNIVYMHNPPFSSGPHGSSPALRWPYKEWGATAVLAGHDHDYERILRDGLPYFVNGLGGKNEYTFNHPVTDSQIRYRDDYGAMLVEASRESITFRFYTRSGQLVDEYSIASVDK